MIKKRAKQIRDIVVGELTDLYNVNTGAYVFCYSENGSMAVYYLSSEEAFDIACKAEDEYWGAFLGAGGNVYDDPMEFFESDSANGVWVKADESFATKVYPNMIIKEV